MLWALLLMTAAATPAGVEPKQGPSSDLTMIAGGAAAGVVGGMLIAVPLVTQNRIATVGQTASGVGVVSLGAALFVLGVDLAGPFPWWSSFIVAGAAAAGTAIGVVGGGALGGMVGSLTQSNTVATITTTGGAFVGAMVCGAGAAVGTALARDALFE
jgi:hypothetical protein